MKITRLKLVNFIGIKHGTGRDEIEIFFDTAEEPGKKIVMLTGGNGSGKTTILSQLHPFKDSYDDRKKLIIEDTEGRKEIDIRNDSDLYEIVHYYGKSKSFVKKNGVEMNENGGVETFKDFIFNEIKLTPDYLKLGKIGSNTDSFIKLTTSERKEFITKLLPNLEDYSEKFEIVKKKFNELNANLKKTSSDLDKLEKEEIVKANIDRLTDLISTLDNQIEKSSNRVAVLTSEIDSNTLALDGKTLQDIITDKANKTKQQNDLTQSISIFEAKNGVSDIDNMDKIIEEKDSLLMNLNTDVNVLNSQKKLKNEETVNLKNDISKIKITLNGPENSDNPEELKKNIDELRAKEKKALKEVKTSQYANILKTASSEINNYLYKFEQFKNFVIKYFNDLRANTYMATKTNIELFSDENFETNLISQEKVLRDLISETRKIIEEKRQELYLKQANAGKLDILNKRPDECVIDTCPFIRDALKYKDLPKEIDELETFIKSQATELEKNEAKAERYIEMKSLYQNFNTLLDQLNVRTNIVYQSFINKHGTLLNQVKGNLSELQKNSEEFIEDINKIYDIANSYISYKTNADNLQYKLDAINNSSTIRASLEKDLEEKEKLLLDLDKQFNQITLDAADKVKEFDKEKEIRNEYKATVANMRSLRSVKVMLSTLKSEEEKVIELTGKIASNTKEKAELEGGLVGLRKTRTESNEELKKNNGDYAKIEGLKASLEDINKNHKNLDTLYDALSTKTGIPLVFITAYLDKTGQIVNELLKLAYKDGFEIEFVPEEKDFFIRVRAGDNIKNDIRDASQGEVALTTISISLALIQQSMEKFNILMLDEIDGPLDTANRENFITILNKQIDSMGIEQVFVISHNNAFDTEEMDLVMLKGSPIDKNNGEFMKNKRVIFDITEN
jgi:DNA repair exonuclease SbcCD ATPase subunit